METWNWAPPKLKTRLSAAPSQQPWLVGAGDADYGRIEQMAPHRLSMNLDLLSCPTGAAG